MTNQEKQDLEIFNSVCDGIRRVAFFSMKHALRMTNLQLVHSGFRTRESAAIAHFRYAQGQIDKLIKEFISKYPN